MAEITRPGLLQFLEEQAPQINAHSDAFQVLTQLPQREAPDTRERYAALGVDPVAG